MYNIKQKHKSDINQKSKQKNSVRFRELLDQISACFTNYSVVRLGVAVHKLNAKLSINEKTDRKILTATPEGKENTAAENFSCKVYDVSIVNCSWAVGREAPKDTQYHLTFRHRKHVVPCEDYRRDTFGRQVGCVWKSPNLNFSWTYNIQLVGSSNETSIPFYDEMLRLEDHIILDPPRNISLKYSSTEPIITWEMPETYKDAYGDHCFLYDIDMNGNITSNLKKNSNTEKKLLPNEKVNVSMRVKWEWSCSKNTEPSRWSEPLTHGKPQFRIHRFNPSKHSSCTGGSDSSCPVDPPFPVSQVPGVEEVISKSSTANIEIV
ncbi:granulocyte-macrophage colony-stimulating factor receptor subunit alpha-like [Mantella aurantiaca]